MSCRSLVLSASLFFSVLIVRAQAPDGLMCDLTVSPRYQAIDGYPVPIENNSPDMKVLRTVRILNRKPAFSWVVNNSKQNVRQTAWQILIADQVDSLDADKANIWNSGKTNGQQSSGVLYQGPKLLANHDYFWKVRVWNNYHESSPYSRIVRFHTADSLEAYGTESYGLEKSDEAAVTFRRTDGVYRADFGRDAFGTLKLSLSSDRTDESIVLRIGEKLDKNGFIDQKPGGSIRYGEYHLRLDQGIHTYQLQIHRDIKNTAPVAIKMPIEIGEVTPFRYCEVIGYSGKLEINNLTRVTVNYPFNDFASSFHSSDTALNRVWELCKYSVKATSFAGIYVDGDRERTPYEADTYINQLCHYAVDREYSIARLSHEYLITHANWPTEWILQSVLIAWNDYLYTGDIRSAQYFYNELKAKTLIQLEDSNGLITVKKTTPGLLSQIHMLNKKGLQDIVDWPHTGGTGLGENERGETDGFVFTPYNAVSNAFYYRALVIMQALAADLGKKDDAAFFAAKAGSLKKIYNQLFWDSERGVYCDGITTRHASLHSNVFALALGLVEEKNYNTVLTFIKSRGMACSVYGSQFLLDAVYDGGEDNYGLSLLTSKTGRSWIHMLDVGSTITMEAWDNKFKPNQDWNHIWGAAPVNIISRKLMGIEPDKPGWSEFIIAPKPGNLQEAEIKLPTIKGDVLLRFTQEQKVFRMWATIPSNTVARVRLPLSQAGFAKVTMDGKMINPVKNRRSLQINNVGSGDHEFKIEY